MQTEVQTYCEGCGHTFQATYNGLTHWLEFECGFCEGQAWAMPAANFSSLSESQQRAVRRLLERTAAERGLPPLPKTFPTPVPGSFAALLEAPLMRSADDSEWLNWQTWLARQICVVFQIPPQLLMEVPSNESGASDG